MQYPHDFIVQSNLVDPQYSCNHTLIPGKKPGQLMYDNHLAVLSMLDDLKKEPTIEKQVPLDLPCRIHRELTRNVDMFQVWFSSGVYRDCPVWIGGELAPNPIVSKKVIEEYLIPLIRLQNTKFAIPKEDHVVYYDDEEVCKFAWHCHDVFECAHPFIDGNGRTGRLLLNYILGVYGYPPLIIVWHKDRFVYYAKIMRFRETEFPQILERLGVP